MKTNLFVAPGRNEYFQPSFLRVFSGTSFLDHAKSVYTRDLAGGKVKGMMKANHTLIGLQGGRELLSLNCVVLEEPISSGNCGMWVQDSGGNWHGHIVAGNPGSNVAYVAPAQRIQHAIEQTTGKTLDRSDGGLLGDRVSSCGPQCNEPRAENEACPPTRDDASQ